MTQPTEFGKEVKKKLVDINQTQSWLIDQVREKTGMFLDNGYLNKIMIGRRNAPKIVQAIREILELPKA